MFPEDVLDVTYYGQHLHLRVKNIKAAKPLYTKNLQNCNPRNKQLERLVEGQNQEELKSSLSILHDLKSLSLVDCPEKELVKHTNEQEQNVTVVTKVDEHKQNQNFASSEEENKSQQNLADGEYATGCQRNELFYYISCDETSLSVLPCGTKTGSEESVERGVTFSSIGGLETQIKAVREMVEMPLKYPEMFSVYGKHGSGHLVILQFPQQLLL